MAAHAAVALTEHWMAALRRAAYLASVELATEKGAFPLFDARRIWPARPSASWTTTCATAIAEHGIRNALLTSIAPTGTISLFADNVSSGLEPVFSFNYTRNVLMPDGSRQQEEVSDYAYRLFRRLKGEDAPLPDYFVDAQTAVARRPRGDAGGGAEVHRQLDLQDHQLPGRPLLRGLQGRLSSRPTSSGCKGCTTYRPNEVTGAVLAVRRTARSEVAAAGRTAAARRRSRGRRTSTRPAASST